jgi:hypothetical protein
MDKLMKMYKKWFEAYCNLETLIITALSKTVDEIEACKAEGFSKIDTIEHIMDLESANKLEELTYHDTILAQFQPYHKLTIQLLEQYFQEYHQIKISNHQQLLSFCKTYNLINKQEISLLSDLPLFLSQLKQNDQEDYNLVAVAIEFVHLFNVVVNKLRLVSVDSAHQTLKAYSNFQINIKAAHC